MTPSQLDALRAAPNDDAPRLAFASTLPAEDPRRAFIELQCALAATAPDARERPPLEAALARLRVDPSWTADLEAAGLVMPTLKPSETWSFKPPWTFRRGFVEHLFAKAPLLVEHGAAIASRHPVRSLAVEKLSAAASRALAREAWLASIDALSTDGSRAALAPLLTAPSLALRRLRVSLPAEAVGAVLASPALRALEALALDVPDDRAAAARALGEAAPPTLTTLALGSAPNSWGSATGQRREAASEAGDALAPMLRSERLARLRTLTLDALDADAVDALAALPALEDLTVLGPSDAIAAKVVEALLPRLRRLVLGHAGAACAAALAKASSTTLVELSLRRGIGRPAMPASATVAAVRGLRAPALVRLALSDCGFDASVAEALGALGVASLRVGDGDTKDGAIARLCATPLALQVRSLSVTCSRAGARSDVEAIARTVTPALQRLALDNAPRDDEADAAIGALATAAARTKPELRHLRFLHAGNLASFGTAGARALLEHAPDALCLLYVNPTGVAGGTRKKLEERFRVHPGADWTTGRLAFVARGHLEA